MGCSSSASSVPRKAAALAKEPVSPASAGTAGTSPRRRRPADNIDRAQLIIKHSGKITDFYDLGDEKIGEGTFGCVRKCTRRSTKAIYAVKAVSKVNVRDADQFRQEVANMKLMDHPNIIRLYEVFEDDQKVYLVMELCTGGELFDRIVKKGHFSEREAAVVMEQILRAVHYMHKIDVSHRDLKPENFLFQTRQPTESNVLKLIDFGLSCRVKPGMVLTTVAGTASYVAPQVLEKRYDKRCDLWSCGAIMYTVLCGHPPFRGQNQSEVLAKVRKGRYTFSGKAWQRISQDAKNLVQKLMEIEPAMRFTAEQGLADSWIRLKAQKGQAQSPMQPNLLEGLRNFQSENRLKKAALHVITKQISDEQTRDLRDIFMSLDTDSDGTLTLGELKTGLQQAGLSEAAPDLEEIVEGLDVDGSGVVDYSEFMAAALDQNTYLNEDLCWTAFNVFDLDGDGKITRQELRKVLDNGSFEREAAGAREELLREVDGDGDGSINFEEFMTMMAKPSVRSVNSEASRGR
mmetsp:Transcript_81234/g.252122  ORF Transcript_81234/g.252122 Transcript_81234/m.252122 type:complete len:517 (-) Transcript_81234:119-1669(-)